MGGAVFVCQSVSVIVAVMLWLVSGAALCQEARGGIGDWQPGDTMQSFQWTDCSLGPCVQEPLVVLQGDGNLVLHCEALRMRKDEAMMDAWKVLVAQAAATCETMKGMAWEPEKRSP